MTRNLLTGLFLLLTTISFVGGCSSSDGDDPAPRAAGIGRACDRDADCESGQRCNDDGDGIMDGQCTLSCAVVGNKDSCEDVGGADSFCIGADICVQRCETDAECPAQSICSENGWCWRTGPASGKPYCVGTPSPCGSYTASTCIAQTGCDADFTTGLCTGVPLFESCDERSRPLCAEIPGCSWLIP
jgi:hypothetical protein